MAVKTYWNEIIKLEDSVSDNDPSNLHKFIDILAENKLLTSDMFTLLCDARHDADDATKAWNLLHNFAKEEYNNGT